MLKHVMVCENMLKQVITCVYMHVILSNDM